MRFPSTEAFRLAQIRGDGQHGSADVQYFNADAQIPLRKAKIQNNRLSIGFLAFL
jgi:hypothetical protein